MDCLSTKLFVMQNNYKIKYKIFYIKYKLWANVSFMGHVTYYWISMKEYKRNMGLNLLNALWA